MVQRFVGKVEAKGGKVAVIGGNIDGDVVLGERPAPLFAGVPPRLARPLIGRDTEIAALRERLCDGEAAAVGALHGLPGVGKTALATALVYDPAVVDHFRGGILWVGLGPAADVESALTRWASALGVELAAEADASARAQRLSVLLRRHTQGEPVLLVVDDAWKWEEARPFREIDFPGCAHLLTTRDATIARKFAGKPTCIGELAQAEAEALLAERCPEAKEAAPEGLRALAKAVGGLPLGLTLIAAALEEQAGDAQWVRKEIARLSATEARLALEAPEGRPGLAGATATLRAIVEMSVEALGGELPGAFAALGVFAAKPADFAREAAFAVWEVEEVLGEGRLRRLVERGLVERAGDGRFTLHQVPAAVAEARLGGEVGARGRHVRFYRGLVDENRQDWRRIDRVLEQIRRGWAWVSGEGRDEAEVLACSYALRVFFQRRGLWRERLGWTERALDAARALKQPKDAATVLNIMGAVYSALGDKKRALEYFEQALPILRDVGDRAGEAVTLFNIARLREQEGKIIEAILLLEQVVKLDEAVQHPDLASDRAYLEHLRASRSPKRAAHARPIFLLLIGLAAATAILWHFLKP